MEKKYSMLLEEFKTLRDEMLATINARVWGTLTYIAIAGGIVALSGITDDLSIYLILVYSAIPLILHTASRERARIRIGSYIKVIIEPKLIGNGWETYLTKWRLVAPGRSKYSQWLDRWRHIFSLTGIYDIIIIYSLYKVMEKFEISIISALAIIGLVLFIMSHIYLNNIYKKGNENDKIFRDIEKKFKKK